MNTRSKWRHISATRIHGNSTSHEIIGAFSPSQEEWSEYVERLVHYYVANDIVGEEKRRAILLTAVGPATYRLLKTLVSPDEFLFAEFVDLVKKHYNLKPSPIVKL